MTENTRGAAIIVWANGEQSELADQGEAQFVSWRANRHRDDGANLQYTRACRAAFENRD